MYCNGTDEHYIDLAYPFGKTNSSLEFCPPVRLFAESAAIRYSQCFSTKAPVLGTYVDDIFGGFKDSSSYGVAAHFRKFLIETGARLSIILNPKVEKTPLPAKEEVILGRHFNSVFQHSFLDVYSVANNAAILNRYFFLFFSAVLTLLETELKCLPKMTCSLAGNGVFSTLGLNRMDNLAPVSIKNFRK